MASIVIGTDYATRVRNRLGVTADDLTITEIDEMLPVVEYKVIAEIPGYASLSGADAVFVKAGTVAALAAEMCPVLKIKMPKSESTLNTKIESAMDWDKRKVELLAERDDMFSQISTYADTYASAPLFALSGPTRAGNGLFDD